MSERTTVQFETEMTEITDGYRQSFQTLMGYWPPCQIEDAFSLIEAGKAHEAGIVQGYGTEPQHVYPAAHQFAALEEKHKPIITKHVRDNLGAYQDEAAIQAYREEKIMNIDHPLHLPTPNSGIDAEFLYNAAQKIQQWLGGGVVHLMGQIEHDDPTLSPQEAIRYAAHLVPSLFLLPAESQEQELEDAMLRHQEHEAGRRAVDLPTR